MAVQTAAILSSIFGQGVSLLPRSECPGRRRARGGAIPCFPLTGARLALTFQFLLAQDRLMRTTASYARLTHPYTRDNGTLRPATWDEALGRAAQLIRSATERRGPDAFG